jgi:predicted nuclease of restriction endonuclease-like (RecB) superfamily
VPSAQDREWYAAQAVQNGWARATLVNHIKSQLKARKGAAVTNFQSRMDTSESDLAHETLKDPYLFDFLGLADDAHERDIENALIRHVTKFLLELGEGFAFLGRQVRLEVAGDEFFIDLLFYHTRLRRHVVVELKATAFKPEHAGQLNFYLAAVDAKLRGPGDHPTIGLLLCKQQNRLVAEYALSGMDKPIGVAEYQLLRDLPEPLANALPSIADIEAELSFDQFNDRASTDGGPQTPR